LIHRFGALFLLIPKSETTKKESAFGFLDL